VVGEITDRCGRPLEPVHPVVFIDAIHVKIATAKCAETSLMVRPLAYSYSATSSTRDSLSCRFLSIWRSNVTARPLAHRSRPGRWCRSALSSLVCRCGYCTSPASRLIGRAQGGRAGIAPNVHSRSPSPRPPHGEIAGKI
jgi:hypothetical protein